MTIPAEPMSGGLRLKGVSPRRTPNGPLITVVTVVRDGEAHIEQAIRSVLSQAYGNVEYIVLDGGSTDRTPEIIRRYEDRIAYWASEPDQGIYDAMNKGIGLSTGDLIGFLNSDDWYAEDTLADVAAIWNSEEGAGRVIAGRWRIVIEDMDFTIESSPSFDFSKGMPFSHQAMFIPKAAYDSVGLHDLKYRYAADLDMVLRLYTGGVPFVLSDRVLANFRTSGASDRYYRESLREATETMRRHMPIRTYAAFRLFRARYDLMKRFSALIERVAGKTASDRLKSAYFRLKARYSRSWQIR
ncbi:MAG TPA: glycosyltransferase family 2 protein [Candidatus Deferrimicrobiaceae bacterium]|jgi:glycosyltransferase involved in cell wall biosynthesis